MSTSPGRAPRTKRQAGPIKIFGRAAFLLTAATVVISSTSTIAGFEAEIAATGSTAVVETPSMTTLPSINAQATRLTVPTPAQDCNPWFPDYCVEPKEPSAEPITNPATTSACTLPGEHAPDGTLVVVPGTSETRDTSLRLRIEVEQGLAIDAECFAETAIAILTDGRGWTTVDGVSIAQVDDNSYDLRLVLASPATTDSLCYPANTGSKYSCRKEETVIINLMRWEFGTDDYRDDLTMYRHYLLNHEVGHFLGKDHLHCPTPGDPAPVMMQQTKGLRDCLPNGWPTEVER